MRVETALIAPQGEQYSGEIRKVSGLQGLAAGARLAEELGFDGVTSAEAGHDPFLPLVIAAEHTSRVSLGTGVAIAFPRSPMVTAQIAWDLQRLSGGRFWLGLGTQVKGHNERRYSTPWPAPPGPRLREYVLCLKAIFQTFQNGAQPTYFTGKHYQFTLMTPFFNPGPIEHPHVPIFLAALNTYNARLAGELCDGIWPHPLTGFRYAKEVLLPAVEAGARKAGRQLSDIEVTGGPFLALGKDRGEVEASKRDVKQQIAFYASTRTYHVVLEHNGWPEVGPKLYQLSIEGKWREMGELITDEILEEFAVVGTYDEVVPKLKERWSGLFSTIHLPVEIPGLPKERVREMVEALQKP